PNKTILNDFVRMLWEQNVEKVVMLTNLTEEGKMKCEQYWPNEGKLFYGDIKIKLISTETFSDYTVRHLEMNKKNEGTHLLKQYHFHAWPDKGVPEAPWSLLNFVQRISSHTSSHYVVVHCSAGVGRTGTYIAIHNVLRQARETGKLEFFKTVTKLREDRILMVQTALQYEFLHKAVQAALLTVDRTVRIDDLRNKMERNVLGLAGIDAEFK
ncbi:receptor-type tyrosine-protein phosphatase epsilon, partial [Biomphalaria glabrata]